MSDEEVETQAGITEEVKQFVKIQVENAKKSFKTEIKELKDKTEEIEMENNEMKIKFKSLKLQCKNFEMEIEQLEGKCTDFKTKNENLEKTKENFENSFEELGMKIKDLEMSIQEGFQDGNTYQIRSVFDGRFLDLKGSKAVDGQEIILWVKNNGLGQQWIAKAEKKGFKLSTRCDTIIDRKVFGEPKVLESDSNNLMVINEFHDLDSQKFTAEHIGKGKFLIKNFENNLALKNERGESQVVSVPADKDDIFQQWNLIPSGQDLTKTK